MDDQFKKEIVRKLRSERIYRRIVWALLIVVLIVTVPTLTIESKDAKLPDGYTPDRHTVTISGVYLEGDQSTVYDLSESVWAGGNNGTGYTDANGSGVPSYDDGTIVISGGFRYDGHKITFGVQQRRMLVRQIAWLSSERPAKKSHNEA